MKSPKTRIRRCIVVLGIALIVLFALAGIVFVMNALPANNKRDRQIAMAIDVTSVSRVEGGIVIVGTVVLTNDDDHAVKLGDGIIPSYITVTVEDRYTRETYTSNLNHSTSIQTVDQLEVVLLPNRTQAADFRLHLAGPSGAIGSLLILSYQLALPDGSSINKRGKVLITK